VYLKGAYILISRNVPPCNEEARPSRRDIMPHVLEEWEDLLATYRCKITPPLQGASRCKNLLSMKPEIYYGCFRFMITFTLGFTICKSP
jgi:hypothetical protein